MKTKWLCPRCKRIMTFDVDVAEQDFKCSGCSYRWLMPIERRTNYDYTL